MKPLMTMKQLLSEVRTGDTVRVVRVQGEGAVKRRLMDMGITRQARIHVHKVAPLGDPIELTVRDYELTIRKADASLVEVEPEKDRVEGGAL